LTLVKIKVGVDKDDPIHTLFKWMIVTLYGENVSNYYWPNFKVKKF
jgi:hypothetical protein